MGPLRAGKQSNWRRLSRWSRFSESDIDVLVTKEFHHLSRWERRCQSPQSTG